MSRNAFLVAGGTAGHINGAIALHDILDKHGYKTQFISSQRKIDYRVLSEFKSTSWHLNSKALKGKGKLETIKNIFYNLIVFVQVFLKTLTKRVNFAIGFGGFICGPTLLACRLLGIPYYIVEQNSVMGMANKLLVPFSRRVFSHFDITINYPIKYQDKIIVSGNPIRSSIKYSTPRNLNNIKEDSLKILIFGGSLGAEEINEVIKLFVENLDNNEEAFKEKTSKLCIKHQVGHGKEINIPSLDFIEYEQLDYIDNMNEAYEKADVIICRGGASTISELSIIQKPCLIFPYPHIDQHQFHNATKLQSKSSFLVRYIERSDKEVDKMQKLVDFFIESMSLSSTKKIANNININSAQIIFENIQRDLQ